MWQRRPRFTNGIVHRHWFRHRIKWRRIGLGLGKSWAVRFGVGWRVWIGQHIRWRSGKAAQPDGIEADFEVARTHTLWDGARPAPDGDPALNSLKKQNSGASSRSPAVPTSAHAGPRESIPLRASRIRGGVGGAPSARSADQKPDRGRVRSRLPRGAPVADGELQSRTPPITPDPQRRHSLAKPKTLSPLRQSNRGRNG
jgi:hypothetical protein